MTDKELLKIDLCHRLPYIDTIIQWQNEDYQMISIGFGRVTLVKPFMSITVGSPLITEVKPYLRPLSSMTEEEKIEYNELLNNCEEQDRVDYNITILDDSMLFFVIDWLNEHHFDYRGLIPMGLALEAPEDMYK